MKQLVGEKAASADAVLAAQAQAADRDKTIELVRKQEVALRAEVAGFRHAAGQPFIEEGTKAIRSDPAPPARKDQIAEGEVVPDSQGNAKVWSSNLPAGARTRVDVTFALGSDTARSKAVALSSTLGKLGIKATDPVGIHSAMLGVHVTYSYRQDRSTAKEITTMLLVPYPVWSRQVHDQSVRPGAIELFVGS